MRSVQSHTLSKSSTMTVMISVTSTVMGGGTGAATSTGGGGATTTGGGAMTTAGGGGGATTTGAGGSTQATARADVRKEPAQPVARSPRPRRTTMLVRFFMTLSLGAGRRFRRDHPGQNRRHFLRSQPRQRDRKPVSEPPQQSPCQSTTALLLLPNVEIVEAVWFSWLLVPCWALKRRRYASTLCVSGRK